MKRPRVLLLNLSFFFCNMSKMAAQSYSQGINQQKHVRLFRYSDLLSKYSHLKLEKLKICEMCFINGHHRKNNFMLHIKISQHSFVCHYPWNVLEKFHENLLNPHTL